MKSSKDKYCEQMTKRNGSPTSGKSNTGLAIVMTVVIMVVIIALRVLGGGIAGKDDLNTGIGNALPDSEKIQQLFR